MYTNVFQTHDFYLSAYLSCRGMELSDIDRLDPRRQVFVFSDKAERKVYEREYYYGKLMPISPSDFVQAIRALKNKLYAT